MQSSGDARVCGQDILLYLVRKRTNIDAMGCVQAACGHLARHAAHCHRIGSCKMKGRRLGRNLPAPHLGRMQNSWGIIKHLRTQPDTQPQPGAVDPSCLGTCFSGTSAAFDITIRVSRTSCTLSLVKMPSVSRRVVCAFDVAIDTFCPTNALSSVD
jgi:hypothetical protein